MDFIVLIGRILFSILFISSGLMGHFGATEQTAGYAEMRGVSGARPLVLITGFQIVVGGLFVLLGIWPDLGALLLFVFLVGAAFLVHHFWTDEDPQQRQSEMTQFMKDLALAGASLIAFVYFVTVGDAGPFQITGNLFDF